MAGGKDRRVLLHFICARQSKSTEFLPFSKRQGTLPPGFPTLCVAEPCVSVHVERPRSQFTVAGFPQSGLSPLPSPGLGLQAAGSFPAFCHQQCHNQ